jgi:hypothetical protein
MKKILTIFTLILSLLLISSCEQQTVTLFDFDEKYFIGVQEHFYEIRNMEPSVTHDFVSDIIEVMGMKVFRLNVTMDNLFYVDQNDTVKFNQSTKQQMRIIVDDLVAAGVERIVYANDSFIYPYGYKATHSICAPDPYTERDAYIRWLKVNSIGYGMIAAEFPEIKYFEPINEPDVPNNEVLCRNGMLWGSKQPEFMYTAFDEANICVDLCYYMRQEIRKVDPNNKMMTPALTALRTCLDYLEYMYEAIESGCHPTGDDLKCSVDPDDYFDYIDLHPYAALNTVVDPISPKENGVQLMTDSYVEGCKMFYDICVRHGDKEKPHWYTEVGYSDYADTSRREIIGRETLKQLQMVKNELPFVETLIFYTLTDFYVYNVDISENHFGLFTAIANPDESLEMKPIMREIYKFMHNGSEDFSAFDAVYEKYRLGK